jgi:CheY-like chemotaxis protein
MQTTRVLLVGNDPLALRLLRSTLLVAGYEVQTAVDAEEALELLSDASRPIPHIIITDTGTLRRSSPESFCEIEPDPRLENIRTLLKNSHVLAGKEVHCHAFVPKERMPPELVDTLIRFEL